MQIHKFRDGISSQSYLVAFVFLGISFLAVRFFGCCRLNLVRLSTCALFHQKCELATKQENNELKSMFVQSVD